MGLLLQARIRLATDMVAAGIMGFTTQEIPAFLMCSEGRDDARERG